MRVGGAVAEVPPCSTFGDSTGVNGQVSGGLMPVWAKLYLLDKIWPGNAEIAVSVFEGHVVGLAAEEIP